jgi:hypothetical protein
MKLEKKNEKLISTPRFIVRLGKYAFIALSMLTLAEGIGVMGYHYICDLSFIDSFHMSSMLLAGMGPVAEINTFYGKLFSSFFALFGGIAFLSFTAVFFAPIVHRFLHILHIEDQESNQ